MPRKKKEEVHFEPKVLDLSVEDIMADRFSRYSKSIIQERALPDARDGLKPVQRRILWSMKEDGNVDTKPYRKSAKTVGNVIGNYHPHGDSSVYDAIVRMSQDWKARWPLIDMQGNNGSIDDDPAAAMRYTEARLSPISSWLMEDIDHDTVEWAPNFSDDKMEPIVLPAAWPNLMTQGITGIAAGYATNIPPHNLNESVDAAIYRAGHPDCSLDEIMEIIKGPDFPTGGIVMGKEGIRQAFETGRGRVLVRGKAEIEEQKTINRIVIDEIPYEVNKSQMVKKMDEIRLAGKVSGILDVRDESDRNGLRIVVDLKKEANAQAILTYFYKATDLQVSYNYNSVAIVNQAPKLMGILDMLDTFLAFRDEVILKRSQFDLAVKEKRDHILEGLIRAISILDEVIALIRASKGKADAKARLMETYEFDEVQAEAIVMLQLYRLSNTDVKALKSESKTLRSEIRFLKSIIKDPAKRTQLMIEELQKINEQFPTPRKSLLQDDVETLVVNERDMIADEQVVLAISRQGYVKRVTPRSVANSSSKTAGARDGDSILIQGTASTLDSLIVFTSKGRAAILPVYQITEAKWKDLGSHLSNWLKTDPDEKIIAAYIEKEPADPLFFAFVSAKGYMKLTHRSDLVQPRGGRLIQVVNLAAGDILVDAVPVSDMDGSLAVITRNGMGMTVNAQYIPIKNIKTRGNKTVPLKKDDVVLRLFDQKDRLVIENSQGSLKVQQFSRLPGVIPASMATPENPSGKPMQLFKTSRKQKDLCLLDAAVLNDEDLLTSAQEELASKKVRQAKTENAWTTEPLLDEAAAFVRPLERPQPTAVSRSKDLEQMNLF